MVSVILIVVLLILIWYLCMSRQRKPYQFNANMNSIKSAALDNIKAEEAAEQESLKQSSPVDMTNVSADRGIMAGNPQPDVQHCYWGSDLSQDLVDQLDRLNTADYVTPLVLSRSGLYQSCSCNCLGDMVGKVVYD